MIVYAGSGQEIFFVGGFNFDMQKTVSLAADVISNLTPMAKPTKLVFVSRFPSQTRG
jgi:hypothetical protein